MTEPEGPGTGEPWDRGSGAWPSVDDAEGFENMLRERAYEAGLHGASHRDLFGDRLLGRSGWVPPLIDARVEQLVAAARRRGRARREELERTINSCRTRKDAEVEEAKSQDRRRDEIGRGLRLLEGEFQRLDDEERKLTPGQRSGRLVGKEAVMAGVATGAADGAALMLTLSGLGGALWTRLLVAVTLALALNVAVLASARMVAGLWGMVSKSSRALRVALVGLTLGILSGLVAGSLLSAGAFRRDALLNLDRGLPTDPIFLIWIGGTAAFSATVAVAWWHYSREGDRIARRRRQLERKRGALEQAARAATQAAELARARVYEILRLGDDARSNLNMLPGTIQVIVEQQHAVGKALLPVAKEAYVAGRLERQEAEKALKREPTIGTLTERKIDEAIDKILGSS